MTHVDVFHILYYIQFIIQAGATALMAALQGAAVSHLGVVVVPASHQFMIAMGVMHLLMPTMGMSPFLSHIELSLLHFFLCYDLACSEA